MTGGGIADGLNHPTEHGPEEGWVRDRTPIPAGLKWACDLKHGGFPGAERMQREAAEGDAAAGAQVFATAGCTGCHTLAAAGSNGNVGPNLDEVKPDYATVMQFVTNGKGAMPAFSGQLSEDDIKNVAAYVSQNAGK